MNKKIMQELRREALQLNFCFGETYGYEMQEGLFLIGKMVTRHHKLCEDYCNKDNFNYKLIEWQEAKIRAKVKEVLGTEKVKLEFQQDPRGLTARIMLNHSGKEGKLIDCLLYYSLGLTR